MVSVYSLNYGPFTHHLSELSTSSQGLFLHVRLCGHLLHICGGLISIKITLYSLNVCKIPGDAKQTVTINCEHLTILSRVQ